MAVRPKKYASKGGRVIRAVKLTEANYKQALEWVCNNAKNLVWYENTPHNTASCYVAPGGDVSNQRLRLHIAHEGLRVAKVGDVVAFVVGDDGKIFDWQIFIIKNDIFTKKYTEVKTPRQLAA